MTLTDKKLSDRMKAIRAMRPTVPIVERFWSKVRLEPFSGCWLWVGGRTADGYGMLGIGTREQGTVYAHIFSYTIHKGHVPKGLELDHLCRIRHCANPDHVEPVTRFQNFLRGNHPYAIRLRKKIGWQ